MPDVSPIDVHVGKRLRFGRTMAGLSQESIGEVIGVTFQQIQKYERGINCIRASKLFELAKSLKVPMSFFFEGYEKEEEKYFIPGAADSGGESFSMDLVNNSESIELMRAFSKIQDPKVRASVVDLVRNVAKNNSSF